MVDAIKRALVHVGTSSFTAKGWEKAFYPPGIRNRDYLSYYATKFDTLEIDSTFYGIPAISTARNWHAQTPAGFRFALKAPQEITHERVLVDAEAVLWEFLQAMEPLGEKLGMVLLQFPYFSRNAFAADGGEFAERLKAFLEKLPSAPRFVVEIRNQHWLTAALFDLLREHKVALALIDHPWMPRPEVFAKMDAITTDFTYIRWLGDRKEIEARTTTWDKSIVDRTKDLQAWAAACQMFLKRNVRIYAYANNHYGGFAPGTARIFEKIMGIVDEPGLPEETGFFLTPG
jgi:uncharacterized protein YecE (DUF72 family)